VRAVYGEISIFVFSLFRKFFFGDKLDALKNKVFLTKEAKIFILKDFRTNVSLFFSRRFLENFLCFRKCRLLLISCDKFFNGGLDPLLNGKQFIFAQKSSQAQKMGEFTDLSSNY